jgi:hypothetical protein
MILKAVQKYRLGEQPSDFAYWQTRSPQERLAALEAIRAEYHGFTNESQQGLLRVYRIVKRT